MILCYSIHTEQLGETHTLKPLVVGNGLRMTNSSKAIRSNIKNYKANRPPHRTIFLYIRYLCYFQFSVLLCVGFFVKGHDVISCLCFCLSPALQKLLLAREKAARQAQSKNARKDHACLWYFFFLFCSCTFTDNICNAVTHTRLPLVNILVYRSPC